MTKVWAATRRSGPNNGATVRKMVTKRSVSLLDDVASRIEQAAAEDGVSFSSWLSAAADRQLRLRRGLQGVAEWEAQAGTLTPEERASGEALLDRLLAGGRTVG